MLILTRNPVEPILIGDYLVTVVEIRGDKVRLHKEPRPMLDPAWLRWNDGIILRLCMCMAEEEDYIHLPILADALEEAGCTDETILRYCRSQRPAHRRAKYRPWVIDLILAAAPQA